MELMVRVDLTAPQDRQAHRVQQASRGGLAHKEPTVHGGTRDLLEVSVPRAHRDLQVWMDRLDLQDQEVPKATRD